MNVRIQFTDAESLLIVPRVEALSVPHYSTGGLQELTREASPLLFYYFHEEK
jgi:hypothetical protein